MNQVQIDYIGKNITYHDFCSYGPEYIFNSLTNLFEENPYKFRSSYIFYHELNNSDIERLRSIYYDEKSDKISRMLIHYIFEIKENAINSYVDLSDLVIQFKMTKGLLSIDCIYWPINSSI